MGSDGRRRHRSREDRRRGESSRRHEEEERESGADKLTEEERRLYDKARAFVEQEDNKGRQRSRSDRHRSDSSEEDDRRRNKGRKKKSRDKYNSSDDNDDDDSKRHHRSSSHRDRKKHHHKRSSRDRDDRHEKSRQKKKSKHRHHHDDDEDKKHRSNRRHKHHHHDDSSFRRKATEHNNNTLSKLVSLGEIASEPPQELLDTDTNYFSHNSHLRLYLFRRYGIHFEDLTSEESHDAFQEFVSKYNEGKLEAAYYDTKGKLPQEALDQCQRTQHKWNFKTNKVEEQSLKIVRDGVKKQTEYDADGNDKGGMMQRAQATTVTTAAAAAAVGPKPADQSDEITNTISHDERRRLDKQHRERIKVGNEEMYGTGKADHGSRERMIEKKREQSNKIHGAARDREGGEAGLELDDKAIYGGEGGGDVSYEAALAREKKYRERKEAAKQERTSELLKKEEEKQKQMLEMLGLKPGEKIKIAPRQP